MVEVVVCHDLAEVEAGNDKQLIWVGTQTFTITYLKDDGKTLDINAVIDHNKHENNEFQIEQNNISKNAMVIENNQENEEFVLGIEEVQTSQNVNNNQQLLVKRKRRHKNNGNKNILNNIQSESNITTAKRDDNVHFIIDESSRRNSGSDVSVYCLSDSSNEDNNITELPNTTCEFCLKNFPSTKHKKRHKRIRHYYCVHCNKQYHDAYSIQEHPCANQDIERRKKYNEFINNLTECSQLKVTSKSVLKLTDETKQNCRVKCPICNKGFRTHYLLKRHSVIHTGEKPYKCKNCNRAFTQIAGLNRHKVTMNCTPQDNVKTFTCQECKKTFKDIIFLQLHQQTHHFKENNNGIDNYSNSLSSFTNHNNDDVTFLNFDDEAMPKNFKILNDEVDYTDAVDFVKQMFND